MFMSRRIQHLYALFLLIIRVLFVLGNTKNITITETQELIDGPLAMDSTSYLSFPMHFRKSCIFTISLWVWVYKSKISFQSDLHVLATRISYPIIDSSSNILLPTILFDQFQGNRFFFGHSKSHQRDIYQGNYLGEEIQFHTWTHLTMSFGDSNMHGYINGEHVGTLVISDTENITCNYKEYSNVNHINNTIMQIGGNYHRAKSMVGMVAGLRVTRGEAMDALDVAALMTRHPPPSLPTLNRLLVMHGKPGLAGRCVRQWRGSYFLQLEWGFCPESVCGHICIDETFFHPTSNVCKERTQDLPAWGSRRNKNKVIPNTDITKLMSSPLLEINGSIINNSESTGRSTEFKAFQKERLSHFMAERNASIAEQQAERLYDAAMLWMNGRHSSLLDDVRKGQVEWDRDTNEASKSALLLALWLADDAVDTPTWSDGYSTPLAQSIATALGFRSGFGTVGLTAQVENNIQQVSMLSSELYNLTGVPHHRDTKYEANKHIIRPGLEILSESPSLSPGPASCDLAATYYFPAAHYSASHFGKHTGVDHVRSVRLQSSEFVSDFLAHLSYEAMGHVEVDAGLGDAPAIVWLAQRYLWGDGLVALNLTHARVLFEKAAALKNAEAQLFLGTFYSYGHGGVKRNISIALRYYKLSANNPVHPNQRAFHALGNYYAGNDGPTPDMNLTLAKQHFLRSAEMGFSLAHYSYAMMIYDEIRFNLSSEEAALAKMLFHLGTAISLGDVSSTHFLAHALYDPDAWLGVYYRQHLLDKISNPIPMNNTKIDHHKDLSKVFNYTYGAPIVFYRGLVRITIPYPYQPSCTAALPLLKHLSEMSYRGKQLNKIAAFAYSSGDLVTAADLFDEAADLGMEGAQENAIFIHGKLRATFCRGDRDPSRESFAVAPATHGGNSSKMECERYFDRLIARRLLQLANTGVVEAKRLVADRLVVGDAVLGRDTAMAARLYAQAAERGDSASLLGLGWLAYFGADNIERNVTSALNLFIQGYLTESNSAIHSWSGLSSHGLAPLIALAYVYSAEFWYMLKGEFMDESSIDLEITILTFLVMAIVFLGFGIRCRRVRQTEEQDHGELRRQRSRLLVQHNS